MAVPAANGAIYLSKLGLEKAADDYDHGTAWPSYTPLSCSLKHVSTSGKQDLHGDEGYDFEATNTNSCDRPDGDAPYSMQEFLEYDHDATGRTGFGVYSTSVPKPVFACSQSTDTTWYFPDTTPAVNDYVFTSLCGTSVPSSGNYGYAAISSSTNFRFTLDGSGQITAVASCSDRRLKKNIRLIGYSPSGLKIYAFEYVNKLFGHGVFQGVMSDEIPNNAIIKNFIDIYDGVDYSKIDVEFKRI
tara:strand:+ start:584 stop:1315 length:732 start_codon:yes stop_codon:yes gene_type:complete